MITRCALTGILLLSGSLRAQEPDTLSVEEAVARAAEHSRLLRVSAARGAAADARAGEASAAMLPAVKLEASYRRLSEVDPFQVRVPSFPAPVVISPSVENSTNLRTSIQMPLFAGFRLRNSARAAEALAAAAGEDARTDSGDVRLAAVLAYWQTYAVGQVRAAVDSNVLRLHTYEEDVRRLHDAGAATDNDLLRVQVQLGTARLQALDAAHDEDLARATLNTLLGNPLDRPVVLRSDPGAAEGADEPPVPDLRPDRRADLRAAEDRVRAAEFAADAARGAWWPQIGVHGGYTYARPNARILPTLDEFRGTWDLGLVLQMDLWNWGLTARQADAAEAALRQAEAARDQLQDQALLDIRRQALAVDRARARVDVARLTRDQAAENLRSLREKFRMGLATSTELLDADVADLQARSAAATAAAELAVARTRLRRARGELP